MAEPLDPKNADKRTWERYARSGLLDEKAYERHVKGLPDVAEKAAPVETTMIDLDEEEASEADDADETETEGQ